MAFSFSVRLLHLLNQVTWNWEPRGKKKQKKILVEIQWMNKRVQCFHVCVHCGGGLWPPPAIYSPAYFEVPSSLNFCPPPLYTSVYSLYDWTLIETCARYLRKHSRLPYSYAQMYCLLWIFKIWYLIRSNLWRRWMADDAGRNNLKSNWDRKVNLSIVGIWIASLCRNGTLPIYLWELR